MAHTIKMKREGQEPCFADVHPNEVDNFKAGGFEPVEAAAIEQGAAVHDPRPDPFDHDGDGKPGGSLPGKRSTVAKGAKRRKGKSK